MGKITKVVLDTNLILSAYGWGGKPDQVLKSLIVGRIHNFISSPLIAELQKSLAYDKFDLSEEKQSHILETILEHSVVVAPEIPVSIIPNNDPDNRILECALEAKVDCIVTGDKPLQALHPWSGIQILSPAAFLKSGL